MWKLNLIIELLLISINLHRNFLYLQHVCFFWLCCSLADRTQCFLVGGRIYPWDRSSHSAQTASSDRCCDRRKTQMTSTQLKQKYKTIIYLEFQHCGIKFFLYDYRRCSHGAVLFGNTLCISLSTLKQVASHWVNTTSPTIICVTCGKHHCENVILPLQGMIDGV